MTTDPSPRPDRDVRAARGRVRGSAKPSHEEGLSTRSWDVRPSHLEGDLVENVTLECGWGRLVFGQTFDRPEAVADVLRAEAAGARDICVYLTDPHVLV